MTFFYKTIVFLGFNSTKSYFDTNLELLNQNKYKELFHGDNPIVTKSKDEPPTQYTKNSLVTNSIIGNGSYIEGTVKNCVIGRKVYIGKEYVGKTNIYIISKENKEKSIKSKLFFWKK